MTHDLDRFLEGQRTSYDAALAELRAGRKTGHWVWFVFPQLAGLGQSEISRYYAIESLDEARAYLAHPVLGPRLHECAEALLQVTDRTASDILGSLDAVKVRSCVTLFHRADPDDLVFVRVLDRFFDGVVDGATDARLDALPVRPGP